MNIAVLFDGAGLARLGLEQAGHTCTGYELNPVAHHLSTMVGSGNCVLADVRDVDLSGYDAIWASPPCQMHSDAHSSYEVKPNPYNDGTLLAWSLGLVQQYPDKIIWVENVTSQTASRNTWGTVYNASQFANLQNRNRIIGGNYPPPHTLTAYKRTSDLDLCPTITATEYKGGSTGKRRASRWYGRRLSLRECAYHQGFDIPDGLLQSWFYPLSGYTWSKWKRELYTAIGNGVPVYMAKAFGEAVHNPAPAQLALWSA